MSDKLTALSFLVKIDLFLDGYEFKYPFNIKQQAKYTQHELELHYKENYCRVDTDQKKGGQSQQAITFFEY